jgi:holliday junction DNA helicase RuvA
MIGIRYLIFNLFAANEFPIPNPKIRLVHSKPNICSGLPCHSHQTFTKHIKMISYLKGTIAFKSPTYLIIEVNGVGYHVHISLNTYSQVDKMTQDMVKIHTVFQVKEDSHTLYGFAEESERSLFLQLISVKGVGPSTAQIVLSSMSAEELRAAIVGENVIAIQKVKGIGAKTAKQIILDLKDKMVKEGGENILTFPSQNNTLRDEALFALVALGFPKINVQKSLNTILREQPSMVSVEALIKAALKQLS